MLRRVFVFLFLLATSLHSVSIATAQKSDDIKKILFIAGKPSHGYGAHEHYAGCMLLAKSLESSMPNVDTDVVRDAWPEDSQFDDVDAIVMYSDGGGRHPVMDHLEQVEDLTNQGVGVVCLHYAVEVPKGPGGEHLLEWIGGYFETDWSVNPHWKAEFNELPEHEITRGVEPFDSQDEWYYHMRFRPKMENVTPILTAIPPAHTLTRPDGPHSGNPHVRAKAGQPQHVAWAVERADGGRGFGFTGGHFHWNWGNPDFRRLVLNAIVWTAGAEVPSGGVAIEALNLNDLRENQDFQQPGDFDEKQVREVHGVEGGR